SLDTVVSQINTDTSYGVYAVNSGGSLILASRTTGAASPISLSTGGNVFGENVAARKTGVDAAYTLDCTAYTSPSNTISAATTPGGGGLPGAELTLKKADATTFTVTVGNPITDKQLVTDKLKAFVDAYNTAM